MGTCRCSFRLAGSLCQPSLRMITHQGRGVSFGWRDQLVHAVTPESSPGDAEVGPLFMLSPRPATLPDSPPWVKNTSGLDLAYTHGAWPRAPAGTAMVP